MREELNVKELRFVSQADELGSYEVKPNYRALGPRFGKHMPQVAAAVAALDPAHVARALRDGGRVGINVDGHDHELGADDLLLAMQPLEGYQLEREGSHAVALELELDDELRREGLAREIVHAVQAARKARGPRRSRTGSRSTLGGDDELLAAARAHEDYVAGETLAPRSPTTARRATPSRSRAARWPSRSLAQNADTGAKGRRDAAEYGAMRLRVPILACLLALGVSACGAESPAAGRPKPIPFWPGVNLGATVPGRHPGELAPTRADYDRWLDGVQDPRRARRPRLHDPAARLYEALAAHNEGRRQHRARWRSA